MKELDGSLDYAGQNINTTNPEDLLHNRPEWSRATLVCLGDPVFPTDADKVHSHSITWNAIAWEIDSTFLYCTC